MPDDIRVQFGASVGGLVAGVEEVKSELASVRGPVEAMAAAFADRLEGLTAPIEELKGKIASIREPIEGLKSAFSELAEVAGLAYLVEKVGELAREMAELGERTLNMAATLGMAPEKFSQMAVAMELAGANAETASRTMERLGRNIQLALNSPNSPVAAAFEAIGISMDTVREKSDDLKGLLELLADRWVAYDDGLNKTAAFTTILGRGMETLIPYLRRGAEGMREYGGAAQETGAVLDRETAEGMEETAEKMHMLDAAIRGDGIAAFRLFKPLIDDVTDTLTGLAEGIGTVINKIAELAQKSREAAYDITNSLYKIFHGENTALIPGPGELPPSKEEGRQKPQVPTMNYGRGGGAGGHEGNVSFETPPGAARAIYRGLAGAGLGLRDFQIASILGVLYGESRLNPLSLNPTSGAFGIANWLGTRKNALIASGKSGSLEGQIQFLIEELKTTHKSALEHLLAAKTPQEATEAALRYFEGITPDNVNKATGGKRTYQEELAQRLSYTSRFLGTPAEVNKEAASEAERAARKAEEAKRQEAEKFAAAERLKLQEAKGDADQIAAVYQEWLAKIAALYGQDSTQYLNLEREKVAAAQRASEQRVRMLEAEYKKALELGERETEEQNRQAAEAQRKLDEQYKHFAEPIERSISESLTNAVLGIRQQGGLREALLGIEKSVVGGMMNNVVKGIGDSVLKPLFTSLTGQGGFLGGLGNLLFGTGSEATKISLLSTIAANTTAIAGFTGTTAASTGTSAVGTGFSALGAFSGVKSIFGWIGGLFGFAHGGIVPSAAGGWSLPSFVGATPALLHSQEMVLPADLSQGLQNMVRSGGAGQAAVHNHFYGPADGASIGRWFSQNRGDLVAAIRGAWDSGALSI